MNQIERPRKLSIWGLPSMGSVKKRWRKEWKYYEIYWYYMDKGKKYQKYLKPKIINYIL